MDGRDDKCGDQCPGRKSCLHMRRIAGFAMQLRKRNGQRAGRPEYLDRRVQCNQGLRKVSGIGRNTVLTDAQNGVATVHAFHGGTT